MSDVELSYLKEESTIYLDSHLESYSSVEDHEDISYNRINLIYEMPHEIPHKGRVKFPRSPNIWRRVIKHDQTNYKKDNFEFVERFGKYECDNNARLMCRVPLIEILGSQAIDLDSHIFSYGTKDIKREEAGLIWVELGVRKFRGGRENTNFTKNFVLDAKLRVVWGETRDVDNIIPFGTRKGCKKFLKNLYSMYPNKRRSLNRADGKRRRSFDNIRHFLKYDPKEESLIFLDFGDKETEKIIKEVKER